MAERQARRDNYGRPLPTLADVREQSLLESSANLEARNLIHHILEETYRQYLRRGIHVQIEVAFVVSDGTIQEHVLVGTKRRHGTGPGWRQAGEGR